MLKDQGISRHGGTCLLSQHLEGGDRGSGIQGQFRPHETLSRINTKQVLPEDYGEQNMGIMVFRRSDFRVWEMHSGVLDW